MRIKNRIIRDTLLLTVMQLFLDTAALLLNSFITRRLGTAAMGMFSLMGSFLALAGILSNGSAFLCTSRLVSEETGKPCGNPEHVLFHGLKLCILLSTAVSAVILLFADTISVRFFHSSEMCTTLRLMPAALFSGAAAACLKGYFNAVRKASSAAAGDIVEFIIRAAVIMCMTLTSGSSGDICRIMIFSVISGNCFSLTYLTILFFTGKTGKPGRCSISFRQYAAFAFPIMGGGILTSLLSSANDALIPVCLRRAGDSAEEALSLFGIFEAIVIPTLFFPSVALCSMSGIIVSESARAWAAGNMERIRSMTVKLLTGTFIYAIFASGVLLRFGSVIGVMLGGGELAGRLIRDIAPVIPFIYLEIVLEALIKGLGLQAFSSMNYLAEYVIRISAVLIFVPLTGFWGIAVSYYASNVFGNISRLIKVLRFTGVRLRPVKMLLAPAVWAFLTMNGAQLIFRLPFLDSGSLPGIAVCVVIWGLMYGLVTVRLSFLANKTSSDKEFIVQNTQFSTDTVI